MTRALVAEAGWFWAARLKRLRKKSIQVPQRLKPFLEMKALNAALEALLHPKPEFFRAL
jgi:hypothetical protein